MMKDSLYKPRVFMWAFFAALVVCAVDQLTKMWILKVMDPPTTIKITSFFNLAFVWNKGVSFGLLAHDTPVMPYVLLAIAMIVSAALLWWLTKVEKVWLAGAIGLVLGGAVGNMIDRLRFGAVVDFLDFHMADWHWPAFNVADSAICLGVALMIADSLFCSDSNKDSASQKK